MCCSYCRRSTEYRMETGNSTFWYQWKVYSTPLCVTSFSVFWLYKMEKYLMKRQKSIVELRDRCGWTNRIIHPKSPTSSNEILIKPPEILIGLFVWILDLHTHNGVHGQEQWLYCKPDLAIFANKTWNSKLNWGRGTREIFVTCWNLLRNSKEFNIFFEGIYLQLIAVPLI